MNTNGSSRAAIHRQSLQRLLHLASCKRRRKPSEQLGFLLLRSCMGIRQDNRYVFPAPVLQKQPDLNWDNPAVRQDVFDMMNWWLKRALTDSVWMLSALSPKSRGFLTKNLELTAMQPSMYPQMALMYMNIFRKCVRKH